MRLKPIERPLRYFRCVLLVMLGLGVFQVSFAAMYAAMVSKGMSGQPYDEALFLVASEALTAFSYFDNVLTILHYVTMVVLLYRICSNTLLTERGLDLFTPGFFAVSFFIPFVSIFAPFINILKLWRGSSLTAERSRYPSTLSIRVPRYVYVWWIFATLSSASGFYFYFTARTLTFQSWQDYWTVSVWQFGMLLSYQISTALSLFVITKLAQRHSARQKELSEQRLAEQQISSAAAVAV